MSLAKRISLNNAGMPHSVTLPGPKPAASVGFTVAHGLIAFNSGWQQHAVDWGNKNTPADWSALDYFEGVLGWFHQQHIDALATLLRSERAKRPGGKQHGLGHSNGCRLFLECLAANPDIILDDLHLIAAWAVRDCSTNPNAINELLASGQIKRLFLYVSTGDDVLGWNVLSGRTLGKTGPANASPPVLPFAAISPTEGLAYQFNDNTQTHCSWVDPGPSDTLGFNFGTISKIVEISIPAAASPASA